MNVVKLDGSVTLEQAEFVRELLDQTVQHDQELTHDERLAIGSVAHILWRSIKEASK